MYKVKIVGAADSTFDIITTRYRFDVFHPSHASCHPIGPIASFHSSLGRWNLNRSPETPLEASRDKINSYLEPRLVDPFYFVPFLHRPSRYICINHKIMATMFKCLSNCIKGIHHWTHTMQAGSN